jgi:uncharacterized membrane protein YhhN
MDSRNTATVFLSLLALATGALAVRAQARQHQHRFYILKPLATALIVAVAALRAPLRPQVGLWIVAGLVLSLAGDVLLMLPRDRFVAGLASFMAAQVAYTVAFVNEVAWHEPAWALLPSAVLLVVLGLTILPRTGSMRVPVAVYGLVIVAMAWRALVRHVAIGETRTLLGMVGAWLFVASDLSLAWRRFVQRTAWLPVFCLSSYYLAQLLIALSI